MSDDPSDSVTPDDTGKPVVDEDGNDVGTIVGVDEDMVAIDLDTELADDVKWLFDLGSPEEDVTVPAAALERDSYADLAVFRLDADALAGE